MLQKMLWAKDEEIRQAKRRARRAGREEAEARRAEEEAAEARRQRPPSTAQREGARGPGMTAREADVNVCFYTQEEDGTYTFIPSAEDLAPAVTIRDRDKTARVHVPTRADASTLLTDPEKRVLALNHQQAPTYAQAARQGGAHQNWGKEISFAAGSQRHRRDGGWVAVVMPHRGIPAQFYTQRGAAA